MSGAALACLAWTLLLAAARAEEAVPRLTNDIVLATATDQAPENSPALEDLSPGQDSTTPAGTITPPEQVIVEPPAWPQPTQWPMSDGSPPCAPRTGFSRWLPQGMIPYIGSRTPDCEKDIGLGQPLVGVGWRSQPFSIGVFSGLTDGGAIMLGRVNQLPSYYGGINIGWDYDHYWGIEKRLGFGALHLSDGNNQVIASTGLSVTGEYRVMYYPLGDSRWRPFLTVGVGWSDFYFNDDRGVSHLDTVGNMPFGFGLKYMYTDRLVFRTDFMDEFTFGNNLSGNFQYVAWTAGLEFRYGKRLIHMPWHHKDGS